MLSPPSEIPILRHHTSVFASRQPRGPLCQNHKESLQAHLLLRKRQELDRCTRQRILQLLSPALQVVAVYHRQPCCLLTPPEFARILRALRSPAVEQASGRQRRRPRRRRTTWRHECRHRLLKARATPDVQGLYGLPPCDPARSKLREEIRRIETSLYSI